MSINRIIPASEWFTFTDVAREALLQFHALPTNDALLPLWETETAITALKGGRGGGKSEGVADRLVEYARTEEYAKIYYGRKVFDTVRGSCFATLVESIKKRRLEAEFMWSDAATSTMVITHIRTGNQFIPFGSDKAEKLKSIKDPTHIWMEELPEFTFDDFKEIYPTLRTTRGKNQLWLTYNAYSIFTDSWIVKLFDPEFYTGEIDPDKDEQEFKVVDVRTLLVNYTDNYFIDQEDYRAKLWVAAAGNIALFEGLASGAYGFVENVNPWLHSFNEDRNVRPSIPLLRDYPVYLSFDFNNDPFACTAWQFEEHRKGADVSFIHCIKEFTGKLKIADMCSQIRAAFPSSILIVTGDRSGQNEDLGRNQTLYDLIAAYLGISKKMLRLNNTNLEHADSREFCNVMLANYPHFFISRKGCPNLIKQCSIATCDPDSAKPSQLLKDRGVYKMDEFDSMRYLLQTFFHEYAKKYYLRLVTKKKEHSVRQQS